LFVASMTGFARAQGHHGPVTWTWELKSVNGRGLDLRFRLPPGFEALEVPAREAAAKALKRGNVNITLAVTRSAEIPQVRINEALLQQIAGVLAESHKRLPGFTAPSLDSVLAIKGVVEVVEEEEDEALREARLAAVLDGFADALAHMASMRLTEGARLVEVLAAQLDEIERLSQAAERTASARPDAIRERLRNLIEGLLQASPALPEERLAQEAALLIGKADVREELDRLRAHVAAARDMLSGGGAIGRKLDFLCQELNREANTLCSKSSDVELTRIGLDLKAVIEQFREQVQNIE
jgi:uncharacterized protein (TIGR00255 family)